MEEQNIIALTADIVSAHISNNSVAVDDLPMMINSIFTALINAGAPDPVVEEKRVPAVSIRSSVKPDAITCLECGVRLKMLKRHLGTHHKLTPEEYRARWGLNSDYPLVAPEYATTRSELAVKIGLGRKPGTGRKLAAASKPGTGRKPGRPRKVSVT